MTRLTRRMYNARYRRTQHGDTLNIMIRVLLGQYEYKVIVYPRFVYLLPTFI